MEQVLTKKELKTQVKRFLKDKSRGISSKLFSELCGISLTTLKDVFIYETEPLSEMVQRRVAKGFASWREGMVAIMQQRDRSKFVTYRKAPKPRMARQTGLQLVDGQIRIRLGVVNKADYSQEPLAEQLERG